MLANIKNEALQSSLIIANPNYDKHHTTYQNIDKMMLVGGDNFRECLDKLDLPADYNQALCVCGSGDQVLELAYRQFSKITAFDINKISRHILNLKLAAIRNFTYPEYLNFLQNPFTPEQITKLANSIQPETFAYFNYLLKMNKASAIYNSFCTHKYLTNPLAKSFLNRNFSFYQEPEYYTLKQNLPNSSITFQEMNIFEPQTLSQSYHLIYFSNILLFQTDFPNFKTEILPNYLNHLAPGGILVLDYLHHYAGKTIMLDWISQEYDLLYQKIETYFRDVVNRNFSVKSSGFGHGIKSDDLVLAIKKN